MADKLVADLLQQSLDNNEQINDPVTAAMIVRLLQRSIEQNEQILLEHDAIKASITSHTTAEQSLINGIINAFPKNPDGTPDFKGHEEYHTALIEESRERALFLRGLRYKLMEKGMWGLFIVIWTLIAYWWTGQFRGNN